MSRYRKKPFFKRFIRRTVYGGRGICINYHNHPEARQWEWCSRAEDEGPEKIMFRIGRFVLFSWHPGYLTILGLSTWGDYQ